MPDDKEEKGRQYRQLFEASAIAWVFPIAIGLGYGWGYLMDRWFGTRPWLTWIFTGFGRVTIGSLDRGALRSTWWGVIGRDLRCSVQCRKCGARILGGRGGNLR